MLHFEPKFGFASNPLGKKKISTKEETNTPKQIIDNQREFDLPVSHL